MAKIFVSYSHMQGPWVWQRLVPVLRAGRAEPLLDKEQFRAGLGLTGQMDATQDQADIHVLCLSGSYHASAACRHEMDRAIALDPHFSRGMVIPVRLDDEPLPAAIAATNPLWIDMRMDARVPDSKQWERLLLECQADIGTPAPEWLAARDDIVTFLSRDQSVNLLVRSKGPRWRELIEHVKNEHFPQLAWIDLQQGSTVPRDGLLNHLLSALGSRQQVRPPEHDLMDFDRLASSMPRPLRVCLDHFDLAPHRASYDYNLYSTLRYMVSETRHLVLLIQSRTPFVALLPVGNPLSTIDIKEVALG